jgi:hypothetical protein
MMHNECMRTTVTIPDDALEIASVYAKANDITLGKALGELVRKAATPQKVTRSRVRVLADGLPVFPSRGKKITLALVKKILDEDLE